MTNREDNMGKFMNPNEGDLNSSAAVSSISKNQDDGKNSEATTSVVLNKDTESINLQSNKTTIGSHVNEATREKKFKIDTKKNMLKTNNGKYMLSKKMLNLGSKY